MVHSLEVSDFTILGDLRGIMGKPDGYEIAFCHPIEIPLFCSFLGLTHLASLLIPNRLSQQMSTEHILLSIIDFLLPYILNSAENALEDPNDVPVDQVLESPGVVKHRLQIPIVDPNFKVGVGSEHNY